MFQINNVQILDLCLKELFKYITIHKLNKQEALHDKTSCLFKINLSYYIINFLTIIFTKP